MTDNRFGQTLQQYRTRAAKSIPTIATEVGVDRTYLYRLETQPADWLNRPLEGGQLKHPSRDLVIRLSIALHLSLDECDELLLLAGYAPLFPLGKLDKAW
jgi:DNA-binding XRE family transcriptional regulator